MPILKNLRHERFAREYVKTGIGAEAYRRVYPRVKPLTTARAAAARLLAHDSVSRRTNELREQAMKRSDITFDKILTDYQDALEMARRLERPADMKGAAEAQAKLVGLLRERVEAGSVGDFDTMDNPIEIIEAVRLESGEEAANALARAFGLDKDNDLEAAPVITDAIN